MAFTKTETFKSRETTSPTSRKQSDRFEGCFSLCHNTLHFTACRILGDSEKAESAVQSCRRKVSRIPHDFESKGAFRSWILRLLIAEALSILPQTT